MTATVFRQAGEQLDYTPSGAVAAGDIVIRGGLVGHSSRDIAANVLGALQVEGVVRFTKASSTVFSVANGDGVYWDASGELAVTTQSAPYLGVAVGGGADGETYVDVLINRSAAGGNASAARVLRVRATTAQVNAGLTLLPAIAGRKYRVHDVALIAIGGAAGAVTTVDILGTQGASSVKLLAAAAAALTQNTLLRAGATNATILAAGASFVQNDVNTAITIGKTGSDMTTATHIDVLLTYTVE